MATHSYETRGAARQGGALPLQPSHGATEAAKRTAAAGVSAELRDLTQRLTGGDAGATPKPADVRRAAKEREVQSAPPARPASERGRVRQLEVLPRGKLPTYTQFTSSADSNSAAAEKGGRQPPVFRAQPKASTSDSHNSVPQMPVIFEHRGRRIEITVGDITKQCVDAIVSPSNRALVAERGVPKALADAAGLAYRRECAEHVRSQGLLEATECCVTGAGNLSAYFVIHAVAPQAGDDEEPSSLKSYLLATYWNVYAAACGLSLSSVALPLIGASNPHVPIGTEAEAAATVTLLAVDDKAYESANLTLVRFVLPDLAHVKTYMQVFSGFGLIPINPVADSGLPKSSPLSAWHEPEEVDRVLHSYLQDRTSVVTGYVNPDQGPQAPATGNDRHAEIAALHREVRAAQAKAALLEASLKKVSRPTASITAPTLAASTIDDSVADTHISSVSEWATASNQALMRGDVTDVIHAGVNVNRSRNKQVKVAGEAAVVQGTKGRSGAPPRAKASSAITFTTHTSPTRTSHATSVRSSRYDFKPKSYNGNMWVDQYLAQFRWGAESAHWPREEWGVRLITALEGKALRVVTESRLPTHEKPSFEVVSKLLQETFASDASPDVWLTTLENKKRGPTESLTELSQAILELLAKALPELKMAERQRVAVGYFCRALGPSLRQHTLASRATTLKEALQVALAYENASKLGDLEEVRRHQTSKVRAVTVDADGGDVELDIAAVRAVQQTPSRGGGGQQAVSQPQTPLICQICDKRGHSARDCWRRGDRRLPFPSTSERPPADLEREDRLCRLERCLNDMTAQISRISANDKEGGATTSELPPRLPGSCFNCGAMDHWANTCPTPKAGGSKGRGGYRGRGRGAGNGASRGASVQPLGHNKQ
jgi:O-acetyl-ADP-ribose deacetylase (regulator of RNase III)